MSILSKSRFRRRMPIRAMKKSKVKLAFVLPPSLRRNFSHFGWSASHVYSTPRHRDTDKDLGPYTIKGDGYIAVQQANGRRAIIAWVTFLPPPMAQKLITLRQICTGRGRSRS